MLQILSNATFEVWTLYRIFKGFHDTRLTGKEWRFDLTLLQGLLHFFRLFTSSVLATFSMLLGACALKKYQNFNVITILPVSGQGTGGRQRAD